MRIPKLCFFLAFWLTSSALRGQEYDASCGPVRRQMAALIEREKGELPLERFSAYVHFLEAAPEEPSDCIHREMRGRIAEVEIALVGLKIKQEQYPGRVFIVELSITKAIDASDLRLTIRRFCRTPRS